MCVFLSIFVFFILLPVLVVALCSALFLLPLPLSLDIAEQAPEIVQEDMVDEQLRCIGMLETVKVRQMGFSSRRPFQEFGQRYSVMSLCVFK